MRFLLIETVSRVALLSLGLAAVAPASVIFSDNFDSGSVATWTESTNYSGTTVLSVRTDAFVSPPDSMFTDLEAPVGGLALFVHASHSFTAPATGNYVLTLEAKSSPCSGCTISYDVIVDGSMLDRKSQPGAFEARSFALNGLTSGAHTVTLGVFTTNAVSGSFNASFDDVSIATAVPEPETWGMLLVGLGAIGLGVWPRRRRP